MDKKTLKEANIINNDINDCKKKLQSTERSISFLNSMREDNVIDTMIYFKSPNHSSSVNCTIPIKQAQTCLRNTLKVYEKRISDLNDKLAAL